MDWDWSKTIVCLGIMLMTIFAIYVCRHPREYIIIAGGAGTLIAYTAIVTRWNPFNHH